METSTALSFSALICAFVAAASAVQVLLERASRSARHRSMLGGVDESRLAYYLRNGIGATSFLARAALSKEAIRQLVLEALIVLDRKSAAQPNKGQAFAGATLQGFLSCLIAFLGVLFILVALATSSLVGGVAVIVCVCVVLAVYLRSHAEKRAFLLKQSVPDALNAMQVCFQAGYSLQQTFEHIAAELEAPLGTLFLRSANLLQMGATTTEALASLREQSSVAELSFVAVALDVQHEAGGSMREVIGSARMMIEGELELSRKLRVQTAQAKLSARVVTVIPFVLIAVFSLINEDFLAPFFESAIGVALLALACGMQILGVLMVRRMLNVKD